MSDFEYNFNLLSKWLQTEDAKENFRNWINNSTQYECESSDDEETNSDYASQLDDILQYRVHNTGIPSSLQFKFNSRGRCVSMKYGSNKYHRATCDDPRNGESEGLYFYRKLSQSSQWERVRVWPGNNSTNITIRKKINDFKYLGSELVESFDL